MYIHSLYDICILLKYTIYTIIIYIYVYKLCYMYSLTASRKRKIIRSHIFSLCLFIQFAFITHWRRRWHTILSFATLHYTIGTLFLFKLRPVVFFCFVPLSHIKHIWRFHTNSPKYQSIGGGGGGRFIWFIYKYKMDINFALTIFFFFMRIGSCNCLSMRMSHDNLK